ncbi:hypothetical protein KR018_003768, partial [Drosophila ironensis]
VMADFETTQHMDKVQARLLDLNLVRDKLQKFQSKILYDIEQRLSCTVEDVLRDLRQVEIRKNEFPNPMTTWHNRVTSKSPVDVGDSPNINVHELNAMHSARQTEQTPSKKNQRQLPEKVFVARESYLTALLQVEHMRTIYHIFYIILLMCLMNVVFYDYFVEGRIDLGLGTFHGGLRRLHWVIGVWILEHVFVIAIYFAFRGWALVRHKLKPQSALQAFWTHGCLILYVSSQMTFCAVSSSLCLKFDLPFVSACVLLLESTRLLMKMHAFVRYNAARVLAGNKKKDDQHEGDAVGQPFVPSLRCYIYFLFAPTLIYRDNYPRSPRRRWKFALNRFLEVVAVAFMYAFIHERHIHAHFAMFGLEQPMGASQVIVKLFGMMVPSAVIFLCGFYLILHSWLNFTAELLRFGDRMFYKDWWTAHTYDAYYRNWNVVVHDWLYEYVYKDMYVHVFRGSRIAASLSVFFISALVHEQVLGFALQMFFPVMFVFFGVVGVSLVFLMRNASKVFGNIFLWFSLILGNGLLISLYAMEYYAKKNCTLSPHAWTDYLLPAMWRCYN